ncbi:MAG: hypothetical protein OWQ48_02240 [Desulfurococcus sp.]|nr:hypothetical protein [Desulfurococcus sp.]
MRKDFIRHIVNPVLNKYMTTPENAKILSEVRRMFQQGESTYGFSVYGGNPLNIAVFLKSSLFSSIVSMLESAGMKHIIDEILRETLEAYSDLSEVREAVEQLLSSTGQANSKTDQLKTLERILQSTGLFEHVEVKNNSIIAETREGWRLEVTALKKGLRLKLTYTESYEGRLEGFIGRVVELAKKISGLRL